MHPLDYWLELARGPLFAAAFLVMILGLSRHVVLQLSSLMFRKWSSLRNVRWEKILQDTLTWAFPVRHLIPGTVIFSIVSFLFHIGVIIVPLFLADHIALWEGFLGVRLPMIGREFADFLTLLTIGCVCCLFGLRLFVKRLKMMSRASDYILLILVGLPFITGFMASHPKADPFPWQLTMLFHFLSADLLLMIIPFTKLAHIVLFPFDRISVVHWQFRPGAGEKVIEALYGKEVKI